MGEFLTDNANTAYPLVRAITNATAPSEINLYLLNRTIRDACIYHGDATLAPVLQSITINGATKRITYTIASGSDSIDVVAIYSNILGVTPIQAHNDNMWAILTVDGNTVDTILDSINNQDSYTVVINTPFVLRCWSGDSIYLRSISAYSPSVAGEVFNPEIHTPVGVVSAGDVSFVSKDGIDAVRTHNNDIGSDVIRISAIPGTTSKSSIQYIDLMVRGDDCFEVETIPHATVISDNIVVPSQSNDGVIRVTSKCKPCCQCEDYKEGFDALKPVEADIAAIHKILENAKHAYDTAIKVFAQSKEDALNQINNPENVHVAAAITTRNEHLYNKSKVIGNRCRFSLTINIFNMTLAYAQVEYPEVLELAESFESVEDRWVLVTDKNDNLTKAGTRGTWLGQLPPGGSFTVLMTYARESNSNSVSQSLINKVSVSVPVSVNGNTITKTLKPQII